MDIKQEELEQAFSGSKGASQPEADKAPENGIKLKKSKLKPISLVTFVLGIISLGVGVTFLVLKIVSKPKVSDAEYLVSKGEWSLDGGDSAVVWSFTEIGKGSLTTNAHKNDYDFIWAIEGEKLKIETKWLYTLNNDYSYALDREKDELSLQDGEKELIFKPSGEASEEGSGKEAEGEADDEAGEVDDEAGSETNEEV